MPESEVAPNSSTDEIINAPIIADILNKDHHNANEKIYNQLYGKSAEYITARKAQIAKTMFNGPDQEQPDTDAYDKVEPIVQVDTNQSDESEPSETVNTDETEHETDS